MTENLEIAKYAVALKTAINCWNEAGCKEHEIPCKATLKEFAQEFFSFHKKIEELQKAIRTHKNNNLSPDDNDNKLYKLI
jgi:hypothetical protein